MGCKKAKATKMKIRYQAGYVTFLPEACVATGGAGKAVMVDWRSASIKRVCRSTLAAETMSAVDALGSTQLLRAFLAQVFLPAAFLSQLCEPVFPLRLVTDCANIYDKIHKDGASKLPAEKRLVMDLVSLREGLQDEIAHVAVADDQVSQLPFSWVPTTEQLADELTKKSDGGQLRRIMNRTTLTLKEQIPLENDLEKRLPEAVHWVWWHKAAITHSKKV